MSVKASDWRLKLRYGQSQTDFSHFAVLADGVAGQLPEGLACRPGPAWMVMKAWAQDASEAGHMTRLIAEKIGFTITGKVLVYGTEPAVPPQDNPHGYDISFKPYDQ